VSLLLDIVGWLALGLGGLFCVIGAIGLHRMPDVFSRMHAASVIETVGVGLLVIGMLTQTDDWTVAVRLVIIVLVLFVTSAVANHALARAALHDGAKPMLMGTDGQIRETDCAAVHADLAARLALPLTSEQVPESVPAPAPRRPAPDPEAYGDAPDDPEDGPEDGAGGGPEDGAGGGPDREPR